MEKAWGKKEIERLELRAVAAGNAHDWPAAVRCWTALIRVLRADAERERRAYWLNDLGVAFFLALDRRCFDCFFRALRLTKSPGRRMRTLRRCANASAVIARDYEKARRFYRAAFFVGRKYRLDREALVELREQIERLERWTPDGRRAPDYAGAAALFDKVRGHMAVDIDESLKAALARVEVAELVAPEPSPWKAPPVPAKTPPPPSPVPAPAAAAQRRDGGYPIEALIWWGAVGALSILRFFDAPMRIPVLGAMLDTLSSFALFFAATAAMALAVLIVDKAIALVRRLAAWLFGLRRAPKPVPAPAAQADVAFPRPRRTPGARILIVDDDEAVADFIAAVLEMDGWSSSYAPDGKVGLELARELRPELIFLNLVMPVMNGFEALKHLRADPKLKNVKIVMTSARQCAVEAKNAGADDFLPLPFAVKELQGAVRRYLPA